MIFRTNKAGTREFRQTNNPYPQDILWILSPNENNFRLNEQKEYWFRFDSIGRCKLLQSFTQYKSSKHELRLNTDKYT